MRILLINKSAWMVGILLFVQQIIVASSTFWLVYTAKAIAREQPFAFSLGAYLVSLLIPYLPAAGIAVLLVKWKQEAIYKFTWNFFEGNKKNVLLWSEKQLKEKILHVLNSEGKYVIEQTVDYWYQLVSSTLNVLFNIIVISILIDYRFILAYGLSLGACLVLVKMQSNKQARLFKAAQDSSIETGEAILTSWDNVLIGNKYNFDIWKERFKKKISLSIASHIFATTFREITSIVIAVATFLPSLSVAAWFAYHNRNTLVNLSGLLVTLPRLFLILSYTYGLLFLIIQWPSYRSRIRGVLDILQTETSMDSAGYEQRINWLQIEKQSGRSDVGLCNSVDEFCNHLHTPGRITLRGGNGSGKSSLLLLIKEKFGDKAFYLPCANTLCFADDKSAVSSGERAKAQLIEIAGNVGAPLILLDEWDANLDHHRLSQLSELIDNLATAACVVEVRHRM